MPFESPPLHFPAFSTSTFSWLLRICYQDFTHAVTTIKGSEKANKEEEGEEEEDGEKGEAAGVDIVKYKYQ